MTQHNNTPQVKVNPQDSNYSHLNRPGASVQGDSHYLSLNHEKGVSEAKKKDKSTSSPQGQKKDVPGGGEYDVPGGGEYDVPDNKVLIHMSFRFHTHSDTTILPYLKL